MVEWSISKNRVTTAKKMWDEKRCENSVWVNLWQCWFRLCVTSHLYWLFQFRGICPSWAFNRKFCHWILHGTKQLSALSKLRLRFGNDEHPRHFCVGVPRETNHHLFHLRVLALFVYFYQLGEKAWTCTLYFLTFTEVARFEINVETYYFCVPISLLTGCDTNVALDSRLSLGVWKLNLTALNT